jgi:hypothetical protein
MFILLIAPTFDAPASFVFVIGTTTQLSDVGGVLVEYAMQLVVYPTATHVPFPNVTLFAADANMELPTVIPTHDSAVGGFASEYAIQFVPLPVATHTPFP